MSADSRIAAHRPGAGAPAWLGAAAAGTLAAAVWVGEPRAGYLAALAGATIIAAVLAGRMAAAARRWPLVWVATAAAMLAVGGLAQRDLSRIARDWPAVERERAARATALLAGHLEAEAAALRRRARAALDAPADAAAAAAAFRLEEGRGPERGVVLFERGRAVAWGGRIRATFAPDSFAADTVPRLVLTRAPFYLALEAVARRGDRAAVATTLLDARPPADRLARPLAALVADRAGIAAFEIGGVGEVAAPQLAYPADAPIVAARAAPEARDQVALRARLAAVGRGAAILAAMLLAFIVAVWRDARSRVRRLGALAVALAAVWLVPLGALSPRGGVFDPALYFASFGGPFTATAASLGITAAIVLLALLTLLRARRPVPNRLVAVIVVLLVAGLAPFLLRDLARGVNPPASGVPIRLWLSWQVPLFLAAVSLLLAGASAGRAALGGARGLPPAAAPALAIGAALLGPLLWMAPARWPGWYPVLWVVAIAALALTRRTRALVLTASVVAACGAATLVWGAATRKRVAFAESEIARLGRLDDTMRELAGRFASRLAAAAPPATEAALLSEYVRSELSSGGYAVDLASWRPDGALGASLMHRPDEPWPAELDTVMRAARASGEPAVGEGRGSAARVAVFAVPYADGSVAAGVIAPRTRLEPDDPGLVLLGLARPPDASPPYTVTLTDPRRPALRDDGRWERHGNELHAGWIVAGGTRPQHAHVEIEMRPLDVLIQRGTLVILLDLAIVAALWSLSAVADGGFARWVGTRRRRWWRSYRARLSLALFGFFLLPALVFALWSWRRLRDEDLQSRALLTREALRLVTAGPESSRAVAGVRRLPVLVYVEGMLSQASSPLFLSLAPTGRYLPPEIHLALDVGDEVAAARPERLGGATVLFGYRAAASPAGERAVYAAPAPTNEAAVDQRRRDLGVLVLFSTALGALAALWLSGIAARQLAEPIGRLRGAALAIAGGQLEPRLAADAPAEFQPVFTAFRRMAADLAASREALEESQRRTAAILRNVASGVVAVRPDLSVALANPRADALLGHPLPPGTPLSTVIPPGIREPLTEFLAESDEERSFDLTLGDRQMRARLTRLHRGEGGAVLTLEDITDLSRAQRVLAWGEMARQVAHEIKNPLTPIRLGVQHLRRARSDRRVDFDAVFERNVDRILSEIDRLDEIARAFSRYGAPPADRRPGEPVDVAAIVRDVLGLERLGESGIRWEAEGADEPVTALGGPDELREVLLNLLENARHANARAVRVAVGRSKGHVTIAVSDDGDGIPSEALPRIFDPQFSTKTSGSGLGLAVSRRIIESWGGSLAAHSEVGKGTMVIVSLIEDRGSRMAIDHRGSPASRGED